MSSSVQVDQLTIAERMSTISVSSTMKVAADADKMRREGIDVVDFSKTTSNRSLTLTTSSTSGFNGGEQVLGGTFGAIESVRGGAGRDTLMG